MSDWKGKLLSVDENVPMEPDPVISDDDMKAILAWIEQPVPHEMKSNLGRHVNRAQLRDWAEWDLEHPYVPVGDHEDKPPTGVAPTPEPKEYADSHIEPVDFLQDAHAGYAAESGVEGSKGPADYQSITADPVRGPEMAAAYNALPDDDPAAHPAYDAMATEVGQQYQYMTGTLGISVTVQSEDPYPSVKEMVQDVQENHHIAVLSTDSTGPHPYLSNEQNDQFRAVHDVFGHAMTGRGFDRNGEEAAWAAHSSMFSPLARQAMTSETRGQNSAMVWGNGQFQPQKVGLLPQSYVERLLKILAELRDVTGMARDGRHRALVIQAFSDADNLQQVGHTHHASNGRHFPKDYDPKEAAAQPKSSRYTTLAQAERIENLVRHGSVPGWASRDWDEFDKEGFDT